jgi:serine/threonine protein kinase
MSKEPNTSRKSSELPDLLPLLEAQLGKDQDPMATLASLLRSQMVVETQLFELQGSSVLGCKLERILGAGGMGVTYAGTSERNGKVAVKLVAGVGKDSQERFLQECRVLQSLNNPSIVCYHNHSILDNGTGVLVMDLVEGINLEMLLTTLNSSDPLASKQPVVLNLLREVTVRGAGLWESKRYRRRMLRILADVALGLHAAHQSGIIHRDVKPANVLIREDLSPVVIDFGLARDLQNRVSFTKSGAAMGTLIYMAPEQLLRDPGAVDRRTDIYALGLVLYRAMTGNNLRCEIGEVMKSGKRSFLMDAKQSMALSVDLQAILYRCLDPRPSHRYQTAEALAEDLRAAAGQGVVTARRPSSLSRFMRDRQKIAALTVAALALTSVVAYLEWPNGRYVNFTANWSPTGAKVQIDGDEWAWIGDPIWLPLGLHRCVMAGAKMRKVTKDIDLRAGNGAEWVSMITFNEISDEKISDNNVTPLQFMTGGQWVTMIPGQERDQRFVDGEKLLQPQPVESPFTKIGRHELSAVDGLGNKESQTIDIDSSPVDVQLLPAVLGKVGGLYRRTWSTCLSPMAKDLEITSNAVLWAGNCQKSIFMNCLEQFPCALTPGAADTEAQVELRCRFPQKMRTAVVYLRGNLEPSGVLEVDAGFEGVPLRRWPINSDNNLIPLQEFFAPNGSGSLVIKVRMRSTAAPTMSMALTRIFDGVAFGGHWRDEPPCFAIAADPEDASHIENAPKYIDVESLPILAPLVIHELPESKPNSLASLVTIMRGPEEQVDLLIGYKSQECELRMIERRSWPEMKLKGSWGQDLLHKRKSPSDGLGFCSAIHITSDVDGDGWQEMIVADSSSEFFGPINSGIATRIGSKDMSIQNRWPAQASQAIYGDDLSSCFGECGDWNGDGYPDFVMGAPQSRSSKGIDRAGVVEVVDGKTFERLWLCEGDFEGNRLTVILAPKLNNPNSPWPLLLADEPTPIEGLAQEHSILRMWVGGLRGKHVGKLPLPTSKAAVLLRPVSNDDQVSMIVKRCGEWQDQAKGFDRYEIKNDQFVLAQRNLINWSEGNLLSGNRSCTPVDDINKDGYLDAAFLVNQKNGMDAVVFISGCDAMPISMISLGQIAVFKPAVLTWLPVINGQAATLLVPGALKVNGSMRPVIASITPSADIRLQK